jgi:DNA-binding LytR/AlgR family response regulator
MSFVTDLKTLIERYSSEHNLTIRTSTYMDGAELLASYPADVDLIFLDINMTTMNGLKTAEAIRKTDSHVSIIFLTSMANYALEGYKYNATNFVIKPIKYVRLKDELDRWQRNYRTEDTASVLITNDSGKYKVYLKDLRYIETFGRNLLVHTDRDNIVAYRKMKAFEDELNADSFIRCHSGFIVNLLHVKRVEKLEIELTNGERIPISQPKRKAVMSKLAEYWGGRL